MVWLENTGDGHGNLLLPIPGLQLVLVKKSAIRSE